MNAHIDGIPSQHFLFTKASGGVKLRINATFIQRIKPIRVVEVLIPAVKLRSFADSSFDDRTQPTVTTGKNCLQAA